MDGSRFEFVCGESASWASQQPENQADPPECVAMMPCCVRRMDVPVSQRSACFMYVTARGTKGGESRNPPAEMLKTRCGAGSL